MQKVTRFLIITALFFTAVSFRHVKKDKVQWLTVAQLQEAYSKSKTYFG
jgi:hypothetical protein